MAGKKNGPGRRTRKINARNLPAGRPPVSVLPTDVQRALRNRNGEWQPLRDLDGNDLNRLEQGYGQAAFNTVANLMPGGAGHDGRNEDYREKLQYFGVVDTDAFFDRMDAIWNTPEGRREFEQYAADYRHANLVGAPEGVLANELVQMQDGRQASMRDLYLDLFNIPQAYGYGSVAETQELLQSASGHLEHMDPVNGRVGYLNRAMPEYRSLDDISRILTSSGRENFTRMSSAAAKALYADAAIRDYLHRISCDPTDRSVRTALAAGQHWDGRNMSYRDTLCAQGAVGVANDMAVAAGGSPMSFARKYGDKFASDDEAKAYFEELRNQLPQMQEMALSYQEQQHLAVPGVPGDDERMAFRAKTAEVFGIPEVYGYKSHQDVVDFQKAILQIRENARGSLTDGQYRTWPRTLSDLENYDFNMLERCRDRSSVQMLLMMRTYAELDRVYYRDDFGLNTGSDMKHDYEDVVVFQDLVSVYNREHGLPQSANYAGLGDPFAEDGPEDPVIEENGLDDPFIADRYTGQAPPFAGDEYAGQEYEGDEYVGDEPPVGGEYFGDEFDGPPPYGEPVAPALILSSEPLIKGEFTQQDILASIGRQPDGSYRVWNPNADPKGQSLIARERAGAEAALDRMDDAYQDKEGRVEKYGKLLAAQGISDAESFFQKFDELYESEQDRMLLRQDVLNYRSIRFNAPDGALGNSLLGTRVAREDRPSVLFRDAILNTFEVPQAYGYDSVESTRAFLDYASGLNDVTSEAMFGRYESLDSLMNTYAMSQPGVREHLREIAESNPDEFGRDAALYELENTTAFSEMKYGAARAHCAEALVRDYMQRVGCEDAVASENWAVSPLRMALSDGRNWPDGRCYRGVDAEKAEIGVQLTNDILAAREGGVDAFVEKYGARFAKSGGEDAARSYFEKLNEHMDLALSVAASYEDMSFVPDGSGRDIDYEFLNKTADVFGVAKAYNHKSQRAVLNIQKAVAQMKADVRENYGERGQELAETMPSTLRELWAFDDKALSGLGDTSYASSMKALKRLGGNPDVTLDKSDKESLRDLVKRYEAGYSYSASDVAGMHRDGEVRDERDADGNEVYAAGSRERQSDIEDSRTAFRDMVEESFRMNRPGAPTAEGPNEDNHGDGPSPEPPDPNDPDEALRRAVGKMPKPVRKVLGGAVIAAEQKAEKKAQAREKKNLPKNTVLAGSKTESEYIDELTKNIATCQYNFVTYSDDMARWANPSKTQQMIDQRNRAYYMNMMDFCISPLQHGVSVGNVVDSVGIYTGMILTSPGFKKYGRATVAKAMFPAIETATKAGDKFSDFVCKPLQRMVNWTERTCHMKVPFVPDKIRLYTPKSEHTEEKLKAKKEQILKDLNNGRVPLTPETAALQYLTFSVQAYNAMQKVSPRLDKMADDLGKDVKDLTAEEKLADCREQMDTIRKQYGSGLKTLKSLCEVDGLDEEQVRMNIRTLTGTLTTQHPELRDIFQETAGFTVTKAKGQEVKFKDGTKGTVWRGEYETTRDDKTIAYTGAFTLREPQTAIELKNQVRDYMEKCMKGIDDPKVMLTFGSSEYAMAAREHFCHLINQDSQNPLVRGSYYTMRRKAAEAQVDQTFAELKKTNPDATMSDKLRKSKVYEAMKDISAEDAVFEQGVHEACVLWQKEHPMAHVEMNLPDGYDKIMRYRDRDSQHSVISDEEKAIRAREAEERARNPQPEINPEADLAADAMTVRPPAGESQSGPVPKKTLRPQAPVQDDGRYEPVPVSAYNGPYEDTYGGYDGETAPLPDDGDAPPPPDADLYFPDYDQAPPPDDRDVPPEPRGRDCGPEFRDIDASGFYDGGYNYGG